LHHILVFVNVSHNIHSYLDTSMVAHEYKENMLTVLDKFIVL
jgi:hypothetical protein